MLSKGKALSILHSAGDKNQKQENDVCTGQGCLFSHALSRILFFNSRFFLDVADCELLNMAGKPAKNSTWACWYSKSTVEFRVVDIEAQHNMWEVSTETDTEHLRSDESNTVDNNGFGGKLLYHTTQIRAIQKPTRSDPQN